MPEDEKMQATKHVPPLSLGDASVASIMTKQVKTIDSLEPLFECIKIMNEAKIGSIVVTENGKPVGIFTERDLVKKMAQRLESLGYVMKQVMSCPLVTISQSATVWDALILMGRKDIRRLPVVDDKKLVGIITERDVIRLIVTHQSMLLESVADSIPAASREKLLGLTGALGSGITPTRFE
jgi:CBS domain-containing protein